MSTINTDPYETQHDSIMNRPLITHMNEFTVNVQRKDSGGMTLDSFGPFQDKSAKRRDSTKRFMNLPILNSPTPMSHEVKEQMLITSKASKIGLNQFSPIAAERKAIFA